MNRFLPKVLRRAGIRRRFISIFGLIGTVVLLSPVMLAQGASGEYQVKAGFLYNFAKFVQWDGTTLAPPPYPFTICVLGADPFGRVLNETLLGKTVEKHPVLLARFPRPQNLSNCQIVFISSSESSRIDEILTDLRGHNVLTVGESEGFAEAGGIIEFTLQDRHVRFKINADAASRAGLKISSELLALATIVHYEPPSARSK